MVSVWYLSTELQKEDWPRVLQGQISLSSLLDDEDCDSINIIDLDFEILIYMIDK